jgi:DNA-binding protein HU-beta
VLLLVAIALVLIGVVTLGVGIFSDTLFWVFVSIGSTVLAGIVLYVLYRLGKRQAVPAPAVLAPVSEPAAVVTTPVARPAEERVPVGVGASSAFAPDDEDYDFPIAEYDELRVAEILPLLPELDSEELQVVRAREQAGKARATILARIEDLAVSAAPAFAPAGVSAAAAGGDKPFPIANYDNLKVAEILPIVRRLDADELEEVASYEERGANRQTILSLIDNRLDSFDGSEPPTEMLPVEKAPAKKATTATTAKKVAATKAPAKKAATVKAPSKKAATATKAPAAPAKKAAAVKAPAKKGATATMAPAKKVAVTKAPAKKVAATKAPVKKAAAAKATTATKAPAKKATKATKATKKAGR